MPPADLKLGTYRHYKGDLYTVVGIVTHHETRRPMVLYVSHLKGCVNCRPLRGWRDLHAPVGRAPVHDPDSFCDPVTLPDGRVVERFELVRETCP